MPHDPASWLRAPSRCYRSTGDGQGHESLRLMLASKKAMLQVTLKNAVGTTWDKRTEPSRLEFVSQIVGYLASELQLSRGAPQIQTVHFRFPPGGGEPIACSPEAADPHIKGSYDEGKHTFLLNSPELRQPRQLIETIAHELRHAFQHDQVQAMNKGLPHDSQAAVWARELACPIAPWVDYYLYHNMAIEVDARQFARAFLTKYGL